MSARVMIRKASSPAGSFVRRRSQRWSPSESSRPWSVISSMPLSLNDDEDHETQHSNRHFYPSKGLPPQSGRYMTSVIELNSRNVGPGGNYATNLQTSRRMYSTFNSRDVISQSLHQPFSHSYHTPARVNQILTPHFNWRRSLYTSTLQALSASRDLDPRFAESLHRVVHRACFSTDAVTKKEEKNETQSSKTEGETAAQENLTTSSPSKTSNKSSMMQQAQDAITSASKALVSFLFKLPGWTFFYLTHPSELRAAINSLWEAAKHEAHHYWMGSKLLYADVQTAGKLFRRTLNGTSLTRRERKQLLRTVSDLFRLVPFSMFILIPFMEFALPFALRLFPNMLPSTFQDSLKAEENMKRELQSRIAMAQFFQETLQGMAKEQKKIASKRLANADESQKEEAALQQEKSAAAMLEFLTKARNGEILPANVIIQFASHFHDDLTLDNMPRMQIINMCRYMNIPPYGSDNFLRFQLRHKIRTLVEDDQRILWEGIDSLTKMELREACQERGMRSTGLSKDAYKNSLQQWLDLSVNKHVPISLLVMSRSFFLREEMSAAGQSGENKHVSGLADAISGLDQDIVNEVVLEVATSEEKKSNPEIRKIKLDVLEAQNERILEEQLERDAATKRKEQEKLEQEKKEIERLEQEQKEQQEEALTATEGTSLAADSIVETAGALSDTEPTSEGKEKAAEQKEEEDKYLSTEELDVLTQLISKDPLTREREELERIKSAMLNAESEEERQELEMIKASMINERTQEASVSWGDGEQVYTPQAMERVTENINVVQKSDAITAEEADKMATDFITKLEDSNAKEADSSTKFNDEPIEKEAVEDEADSGDQYFDRTIESLKARVERMVNKIESQIDTIEEKIGDKLHFLDKDGDGIMSLDEMADALQRVLKRSLPREEAMAIAALMDENKDGLFTVDEFIKWIETNKIVQLLKDGQDGDLDRLLEKHSENQKEEQQQQTASGSQAPTK